MKPSDIVFDDNIDNRDKFGVYLRERRLELGMSVRYFAGLLGVSPTYISDIERGNRTAPTNFYLKQIIKLLEVNDEEIEYLYDLAGCTHLNWPEINDYLKDKPYARRALRVVRDKGLTEELLLILDKFNKDNEISNDDMGR